MKILALDSSGLVASVAVMQDEELLAEYTVNYKKTHSQTLLPMLDAIAQMIELDLHTLDAIAVAGGPGSFTGLRIGSATAKGLGMALDVPLVSVPTVDALAYNMYGARARICPMMDARRNQVYTGLYECDTQFRCLMQQIPLGIPDLAARLNEMGRETVFLGDGVPVYRQQLEEILTIPHTWAPPHMSRQRAASVAALGMILFREGKTQTAAEHHPEYLRMSQAERERSANARNHADS